MAELRVVTLKLPVDIYQRAREAAERNRRSVTAELVLLIEHALDVQAAADPKVAAEVNRVVPKCNHPRGRVIKGFCYRCGRPAT